MTSLIVLSIFNIMLNEENIESGVSYREQTAWLYLLAMSVTFGPYLVWMGVSPPGGAIGQPGADLSPLWLYAIACAVQVTILGAGHVWLRKQNPDDAKAPLDERDRAIQLRSMGVAYKVLLVGMILVGCVMPFTSGGWEIVNTAIFMIVIAQVVRDGLSIWSYRRGWDA